MIPNSIISSGQKGILSGLSGGYIQKFATELPYDQNGRIVFTPSKGLVGVGLPRKAKPADLGGGHPLLHRVPERTDYDIALGWEDIKEMQAGVVHRTYEDDTLPDGPWETIVEYQAPFYRPDREEDYRVAWGIFEEKKL
jgi:hypothetical protein